MGQNERRAIESIAGEQVLSAVLPLFAAVSFARLVTPYVEQFLGRAGGPKLVAPDVTWRRERWAEMVAQRGAHGMYAVVPDVRDARLLLAPPAMFKGTTAYALLVDSDAKARAVNSAFAAFVKRETQANADALGRALDTYLAAGYPIGNAVREALGIARSTPVEADPFAPPVEAELVPSVGVDALELRPSTRRQITNTAQGGGLVGEGVQYDTGAKASAIPSWFPLAIVALVLILIAAS